MKRSLRKGTVGIEIWHEYGMDSLSAINTEIELFSDYAVFRTKLKPLGENEKMDATSIFTESRRTIQQVAINCKQIRRTLRMFLNAYSENIEFVKLEIWYNVKHQFQVELSPIEEDGILFNIVADHLPDSRYTAV